MRKIVSPLDGIRSPFGRVIGGVPAAPVNVFLPVISGTPTVGETITTSNGGWTGVPGPTYSYQWKRAGVAITGETNATYQVVLADVGQSITVTVTATNASGSASATSDAVTGQAAPSTGNTLIWASGNPLVWATGNNLIWGTA